MEKTREEGDDEEEEEEEVEEGEEVEEEKEEEGWGPRPGGGGREEGEVSVRARFASLVSEASELLEFIFRAGGSSGRERLRELINLSQSRFYRAKADAKGD